MVQSTRPREKDIGGFPDNLRARSLLYASAGGASSALSRLEARPRLLRSESSVNDPIAARDRHRRRTEEEGDQVCDFFHRDEPLHQETVKHRFDSNLTFSDQVFTILGENGAG